MRRRAISPDQWLHQDKWLSIFRVRSHQPHAAELIAACGAPLSQNSGESANDQLKQAFCNKHIAVDWRRALRADKQAVWNDEIERPVVSFVGGVVRKQKTLDSSADLRFGSVSRQVQRPGVGGGSSFE